MVFSSFIQFAPLRAIKANDNEFLIFLLLKHYRQKAFKLLCADKLFSAISIASGNLVFLLLINCLYAMHLIKSNNCAGTLILIQYSYTQFFKCSNGDDDDRHHSSCKIKQISLSLKTNMMLYYQRSILFNLNCDYIHIHTSTYKNKDKKNSTTLF